MHRTGAGVHQMYRRCLLNFAHAGRTHNRNLQGRLFSRSQGISTAAPTARAIFLLLPSGSKFKFYTLAISVF